MVENFVVQLLRIFRIPKNNEILLIGSIFDRYVSFGYLICQVKSETSVCKSKVEQVTTEGDLLSSHWSPFMGVEIFSRW